MRKPDTGPGFARLCGVLVLILAAELSAVGQAAPSDPDQSELAILLLRMEAARSMNWKIEREYVSDDQAHGVDYNLHGKKIREYTQKLGWIQIGDELCRRLMEENGKPPSEKRLRKYQLEQAGVNQLTDGMEFVVDLEDGAPQDSVFSALPICCLATLFDSRFLRHEVIDGRDNLVVESMPSPIQATFHLRIGQPWIGSRPHGSTPKP
jgi:hypothetical protein